MECNSDGYEVSGEAILVTGIDLDSGVLEIGEKFKNLFNKFIGIDVCFIAIGGHKQVGKSFFCDKILNLAEIKGNNVIINLFEFSQEKTPGLYTFSAPFVKDGLHVFLLEISGCDVNSEAFRLLNTIALILSSSYLYISDNNQKDSEVYWEEFCRALESNLKNFHFEDSADLKRNSYFPSSFYFASRQNEGSFVPNLKEEILLNNPERVYLPNAMTTGYKGNKSDLNFVSFLARECINPEYMKSIFGIFKKLYESVEEKRYDELIVNGNIALKILQCLIITLNSHKKIKVESVYKSIIEELYVSAFNFCILSYHGELEEYFEDEQPKNTDQMLSKFESASESALLKFNEFNLNRELHDEYERRLLEHFDSKESLICSINKQKTQEVLEKEFARINQSKTSFKDAFNILKNTRKELDDGRADALQQKLSEIFVATCSGPDLEQMKKIEFLENELSKWRNRYENEKEKKSIFEENQRKLKEVLKEEQNTNSRIHKLEEQIESLLRRQTSLNNGEQETESLAKIKSEYQKSLESQQRTKENLLRLQNETTEQVEKGIRQKHEVEISLVIQRKKEVEKELLELHQNEKLVSKGDKVEKKSKPKGNSNLNENQVNRSDLKSSEQNKSGVKKSETKKSKN